MDKHPSGPNVVYILADDLGYGDVGCNNVESRIPTPHIDRLAARGMRFSNAHAGSSVCTPSRYNLLTGRYSWRSRLTEGIVWPWDGALIEDERPTVASFLRDHGYRTDCVGKWHLGWDWPTRDGRHPNDTLGYGERSEARWTFADQIDFTGQIAGGPTDNGFDSYFGVDVPNFPPYAWFADDRLTEQPSEQKPDDMFGVPGPAVPGWSLEAMLPELTRAAVDRIEAAAAGHRPFFLYLPLTSPHTPICPNAEFKGMSGIGRYGDFVCETDWVVGQVLDALDRTGVADNTVVVFASDNGPERRTPQDEGVYERLERTGHASMGPLRGIKRDAWEGGHRVPMVVAWPRLVAAGSVCEQTVCLGDLFATCADVLDVRLPSEAAEDSVSMLPLLRGETNRPTRTCTIHYSASGRYAIRHGDWVLIDAPTGDDNDEPAWFRRRRGYASHNEPAELYNLKDDLPQRSNRVRDRPDKAMHLKHLLETVKADPKAQRVRRRPGQ